jgi:hypothetical protein
MKKELMRKNSKKFSLEEEKLDLIRLRIQNGYYKNTHVLENVAKEIIKAEIKK